MSALSQVSQAGLVLYDNIPMDLLENSWWPASITTDHPLTLPLSSKWLLRQEDGMITFITGEGNKKYYMHPACLPHLMLLDVAQLTYLQLSTSTDPRLCNIFYKGVMFLDSLKRNIMSNTQDKPDPGSFPAAMPESMHRWLCRLLLGIPHDPENRKQYDVILKKAYEETDVFKYGRLPYYALKVLAPHSRSPDFLDWSLTHEEKLIQCLTHISVLDGKTLYSIEPHKWITILRSQFVHEGLCTPKSLFQLGQLGSQTTSREAPRLRAAVTNSDPTYISSINPPVAIHQVHIQGERLPLSTSPASVFHTIAPPSPTLRTGDFSTIAKDHPSHNAPEPETKPPSATGFTTHSRRHGNPRQPSPKLQPEMMEAKRELRKRKTVV